jgi:PTS system nitrogen regulatory IIA component
MKQPEIMTIEEVANYLRVSERTVYDWAQKKEIPCGKLGTVWRFKRSEIENWVNKRLSDRGSMSDTTGVVLRSVLDPSRVLHLDCTRKVDALNALIDCLAEAPQVRDREELAKGVFHREGLMSTGIGVGIAVPHVRLDTVSDIVMAAASCKEPITDYESLDGEPVRLIFLIAAGRDQHAQHIKLLSAISSRLRNESLRNALSAAPDAETFVSLLTQEEK